MAGLHQPDRRPPLRELVWARHALTRVTTRRPERGAAGGRFPRRAGRRTKFGHVLVDMLKICVFSAPVIYRLVGKSCLEKCRGAKKDPKHFPACGKTDPFSAHCFYMKKAQHRLFRLRRAARSHRQIIWRAERKF